MPRRDGTGPSGLGPRTGRGMGKCKSKELFKQKIKSIKSPYNVEDKIKIKL